MRIACVQFAPVKGDVDKNQTRADGVLAKGDTEGLDLIVLPEMAFTGYNFKSVSEIEPYLEPSGAGATSIWARTVALKYGCTVVCPYAEKTMGGIVPKDSGSAVPKTPNSNVTKIPNPAIPENFNSAIVIDSAGATVGHYRKRHLYEIDECWASEGPPWFFCSDLPGLGSVAMGISMDINPCRFETPWMNYELAYHALDVNANLLVVSMSWPTYEDYSSFSQFPQEPAMNTLSYWVLRLDPLIRCETGKEVIVVIANRVGQEDDLVYAGTSAVLGIVDGEVRVYGISGRGNKELLVVDTEKPPHGKLLYRPEGDVKGEEPSGFYGDETPIESSPQEWIPTTPGKQSTLGSPRADSDVLGAHEPKPIPTVPSPARAPARPQPPKLSLRTDVDNFKDSDSDPPSKSALTPLVFSPKLTNRASNRAEAIKARQHIDTKIHRPTPHPFAPQPSAGTLFQRATARWKRMTALSPSPKHVPNGLLKSAGSRSSPKSADTTAATVGSGCLSARSRRSSFDGKVLHLFTPSGDHSGSNVSSARSARSKPSPLWTRTGATSQLASPLKDSISSPEDDVKLDAVARELQSMALNMADDESDHLQQRRRDPSRKGRSPSLHDDRRRTPSATPHLRQPRSESQNGLVDLAASNASFSRHTSRARCESCGRYDRRHKSRPRDVPASATDKSAHAPEIGRREGREERGRRREPKRDVSDLSKGVDISEPSFDRQVSQMLLENLKRIEGIKKESLQGSYPGEATPPGVPSRPCTPVLGRKPSPRRSRSHFRHLPPYYPSAGNGRQVPYNRRSWSPTWDGSSRSGHPVLSVGLQDRARSRSLLLQGRARSHSLLPQGRGPKMASTPPEDGILNWGAKGLRSSRQGGPAHGLPTPRCSPTRVGVGGWI